MIFSRQSPKAIGTILVLLLFAACTPSSDLSQITKDFYAAMEVHDHTKIISFYSDSVRIIGKDYRSLYTKEAYKDWLEWDEVFAPTYEILSLTERNNFVEAQIRKSDPRILFLNGEPYVTTERLNFENGKLQSIEIIEEKYNQAHWVENRQLLVKWIAENHPELDGFIFDQTKEGGLRYKEALELYCQRFF